MSSTLAPSNPSVAPEGLQPLQAQRELPDASALVDKMPQALRLSSRAVVATVVVGLVYLMWSLHPLAETDIWGHIEYGRWIVSQRALPTTEPLMPLAQGVAWVDTAWLSQVLLYGVSEVGGVALLQALAGALIAAAVVLVWRTIDRRGDRFWFGMAGAMLFAWTAASPLGVMRPQLFAVVLYLATLRAVANGRVSRNDWFVLPALFVLWANLHGSFVVGLGLLAAAGVGGLIDACFQRGGARSVRLRRGVEWLLLSQVCLLATLLNPYGLGLWQEVLHVGQSPNLRDLLEWQPFDLRTNVGKVFIGVLAVLALLYRQSPRRVLSWEVVALFGLTLATLWSYRFLVWWCPVAAVVAACHGRAVWRAASGFPAVTRPIPRGTWAIITVGLCWIFFAYSPLGLRVLHGKQPSAERAFSSETPVRAAAYLREHPPVGQVFNSYEWGDYLQWAGPDGMQIFVNSHAHLVPREVWLHYLQVVQLSSEWQEILDRYSINTIVLDKQYRDALVRRLKDDARFRLSYEDAQAAVFTRKTPL